MYRGSIKAGCSKWINDATRRRFGIRWLRLVVAYIAIAGVTVQAATVYVYQDEKGSALITDHPRSIPGYTLVRRYGITEESPKRDIDLDRLRPLASSLDPLIDRVARGLDVDRALVKAVIHAESAFDPAAVSRKGAVGLMQLMAVTADAYGVNDRSDPWQNLVAGTTHLRYLLDRYRDTSLALAAYNAGEEAVRRHRGIPPFQETRDYVRKVLHLHGLYREQG